MAGHLLSLLLGNEAFHFLLIFSRLGTAVMLLPTFGGALVPNNVRLLLSLAMSVLMLPVLGPHLPPPPADLGVLVLLIVGEVGVGAFIGTVAQLLMAAMGTAGSFIGYAIGLTNTFVFDPITAQQNQLMTGFLNNLAMVLIVGTDTHHLMIRAVVESYELFVPGMSLPLGEITEVLTKTITKSFMIGVQISSPVLVFSLVLNIGLALLSRLAPQIQVFFVGIPMQIMFGLAVMMTGLPTMMLVFMEYFAGGFTPFLIPR